MSDERLRTLERELGPESAAYLSEWARAGSCSCRVTRPGLEGEVCMCGDYDHAHSQATGHGFVHACEYHGVPCDCDVYPVRVVLPVRFVSCKRCGGTGNDRRHRLGLLSLLGHPGSQEVVGVYGLCGCHESEGECPHVEFGDSSILPISFWIRSLERWGMNRLWWARGLIAVGRLALEVFEGANRCGCHVPGHEVEDALDALELFEERPVQETGYELGGPQCDLCEGTGVGNLLPRRAIEAVEDWVESTRLSQYPITNVIQRTHNNLEATARRFRYADDNSAWICYLIGSAFVLPWDALDGSSRGGRADAIGVIVSAAELLGEKRVRDAVCAAWIKASLP